MADHDEPAPVGAGPRRGRKVKVVVVVLVAALALVAVGAVLWSRSGARPVAIEEVEAPTGTTLPDIPTVMRPDQGVYAYAGTGTDRIDTPPKDQAQGPEMPATVTHREDGCWTFRIDYSTNHWQSWIHCPRADGGLDEEGGSSFQKWDFGAFAFDTTTTSTCGDSVTIRADQQPGDTWEQTCVSTSTGSDGAATSSGPVTFVGVETLDIGGRQVETLHYRRQRTMTGAQTGTEEGEVWFDARTGLPVRNTRVLSAKSATMIGDVTYTEEGEFQLVSGPTGP